MAADGNHARTAPDGAVMLRHRAQLLPPRWAEPTKWTCSRMMGRMASETGHIQRRSERLRFAGRERELVRLRAAFAEAAAGSGGVALLAGGSGHRQDASLP